MENLTPEGSQENVPAALTDGEEPFSSPELSLSGRQHGSKPRKPPTITPRSFTRFFTPKSSIERGGRVGTSRQALRDITASGSNRGRRKTPLKDKILVYDQDLTGELDAHQRRKRKIAESADITPDQSSPLKRIRNQSLEVSEDNHSDEQDLDSGSEVEQMLQRHERLRQRKPKIVDPINFSGYRGIRGQHFQREIDAYGTIAKSRPLHQNSGGSKNWQYETGNLFSRPDDVYVCDNLAVPSKNSIPFCTASCRTNSLVAIGDEDGGVRLLESSKDEKPGFTKAYLSFRPHINAILDLAFSPDDLLLVTASGDQTCQVIDMPTQRATTVLSRHTASVKQVCFQPGSSSVIASSSRDGSVQIWDLRCKGLDAPVRTVKIPLDPSTGEDRNPQEHVKLMWGRPVNAIFDAHLRHSMGSLPTPRCHLSPSVEAPSRSETFGKRADVSITAVKFLNPGREHLILTASEADTRVKLWDLRMTHNNRRGFARAISTTQPTGAHTKHRHFGINSLSLSGDSARLYAACRDSTVYAYATSHLILGYAPQLSRTDSKPRRLGRQEKQGLGPLYGFRHPLLHTSSFYVKCALRPANDEKSELLAVGSSDSCAIVFPTNEQYIQHSTDERIRPSDPFNWNGPTIRRSEGGVRIPVGVGAHLRLEDAIPIYQHGSALVRGHSREVTGMTWTTEGELVTVGDDYTVRCWREGPEARDLRIGGEKNGSRWGCGWAEVDERWDEDDG